MQCYMLQVAKFLPNSKPIDPGFEFCLGRSAMLAGNAEFSPILWTRDEKDRLSVKGIELRRALPGSSSRVLS